MKKAVLNSAFTAALAALPLLAAPAAAQEWSLGAGYSDFSRDGAEDGAAFAVEYRHRPFFERNRLTAHFGAALEVQDSGDVFAGAGIVGQWSLSRGWFVEASVMPGAYAENVDLNDLGSTFEIRSLLGVGRRLDNGHGVSLAIAHKSNASTADSNPGVNTVLLRWHLPLSR
ncbi:acyloxyacyl hydrolase [Roseobacteraceae bacterium NS-SX3]